MNKKEKILIILMAIALMISVGITYYKTIIKQSFEVINVELTPEDQDNQ